MAKKQKHGGKRDGAGRKPKPASEKLMPVAIALSPSLVARLDAYAEQAERSRSSLAADLIDEGLTKREDAIAAHEKTFSKRIKKG